MQFKTFESKVVDAGDDDRTVTGISSVAGVVDAGGDRIFKGAFSKTIAERRERVKHLWQHDFSLPPIATILDLKEVGRTDLPQPLKDKYPDAKGGLLVKRRYLDTLRGDEVLAALKSSPAAITEMSFGYDAVKFDFEEITEGEMKGALIRNLKEVKLWDTSDVNWGMNQATMASMKSANPFSDTGILPLEKEWEVPEFKSFTHGEFDDLDEEEKVRLFGHYAWTKNTPPQSFDDLQFPHHAPSKSGVGPAVFAGVVSAMDALILSSHVPATDRKAIYDHLAKHYEQFGKVAPDFGLISVTWSVMDSLKVLSPSTNEEVYKQLKTLESLLRAEPEPVLDPALLTQKDVLLRLEFSKRKMVLSNI